MKTSVEDIRMWILEAKQDKATHLLIVCDTFSWEEYPVYVYPGENVIEKMSEYGYVAQSDSFEEKNMQKIMSVYDKM